MLRQVSLLASVVLAAFPGCTPTGADRATTAGSKTRPKVVIDAAWSSENRWECGEFLHAHEPPTAVPVPRQFEGPMAGNPNVPAGDDHEAVTHAITRPIVSSADSRPQSPGNRAPFPVGAEVALTQQFEQEPHLPIVPAAEDTTALATVPTDVPFELSAASLFCSSAAQTKKPVMRSTATLLNETPLADDPRFADEVGDQPPLPPVRLKALIQGGDGRRAALLEVEGGGSHVCHEFDLFALPSTPGRYLEIRQITSKFIVIGLAGCPRNFVIQ